MKRRTITTVDFGPEYSVLIKVGVGNAPCNIGLIKALNVNGEHFIIFDVTPIDGTIEKPPTNIETPLCALLSKTLVANQTISSITPPHAHSAVFKARFPLQKKMGFCESSIVVVYHILKALGVSDLVCNSCIHFFNITQETQVNPCGDCWMSYAQYMHLYHPLLNPQKSHVTT